MTRAIALVLIASTAPWLDVGHCGAESLQPCELARETQRRAWRASGPPREQPSTTGGVSVRHWPTDALGTWIVDLVPGGAMTRVTPSDVTAMRWDDDCVADTVTRPRPTADAPRFTDADLATRLRDSVRGVIHVWSPHMPLSVDVIPPLTEAARRHDLPIELLLDPEADRDFATRVATNRRLPTSALRVVDSVELLFRDALVHAPTVQVYADGQLVGSPFPGGHTVDEYAAYFARVLKEHR